MLRRASSLLLALTFVVVACDGTEPLLEDDGLHDQETTELDLDLWQELAAFFGPNIRGGSEIWYIGTGSDLEPDNDYCSVAFAEAEASDSWAIDSSVTNAELTVEDYLVYHLPSMLNAARAHSEEEAQAQIGQLRAFLIRAALRATSIRRFGESDRFGGYHCIEITTPDGQFLMANGGWS